MTTLSALPPLRLAEPAPGNAPATRTGRGPADAPEAAPSQPASALPNPTLRLDASLGLVVLELRDAGGAARTIPSERELEAYRNAARAQAPAADRAGAAAEAAAPPAPGTGAPASPDPVPAAKASAPSSPE